MKRTNELAQKIIKMFIDEAVPLSVQKTSLKLVKEKIDFCRKVGIEINQKKLDL